MEGRRRPGFHGRLRLVTAEVVRPDEQFPGPVAVP
jgi:hypothetical protein